MSSCRCFDSPRVRVCGFATLSPLCYRPTPQTNFVFQAGRQVFKLESGVPGLLVRMRRLFPEREILLRSEGTLRFLKISSKVQIGIAAARSEEHTSELQSLMRTSYAVFCLKKKKEQ